jgi:hypothetical protein
MRVSFKVDFRVHSFVHRVLPPISSYSLTLILTSSHFLFVEFKTRQRYIVRSIGLLSVILSCTPELDLDLLDYGVSRVPTEEML